jgi:hypothetical protein
MHLLNSPGVHYRSVMNNEPTVLRSASILIGRIMHACNLYAMRACVPQT